jgi:hypothetical protein
LKENDTAADIRCIITKGIEKWFLTAETNNPGSIDTVAQIGWFQVLKGYIPTPTQQHEVLPYKGEQWTHGNTLCLWWKDRLAVAHAPEEGRTGQL